VIRRVTKVLNWIEDVRVIPVLVVWQEALLYALLVKAPLLLLQNRCQRQVEVLFLGKVHKVKAFRSYGDGVPNFFIMEVATTLVCEPKDASLRAVSGDV
jgi:hypothetical protein